MSREDLRKEMEARFKGLPPEEYEKVLSLYEELYETAQRNGKTENEIMSALGLETKQVKPEVSGIRFTLSVLGLLFFNIVVVLGPALTVFAVYLSLWAVSFSLIISAVAAIGAILFLGESNALQLVFLAMALGGSGTLLGPALIPLGKLLYKVTIWYAALNIKIARGE
ncbi:DUF1700 domain-containing protein [Ectobacillus sp. JY-23]|uniref:HAAS domain-containing protein n=1 Tax=Ectobacillus sp. JY-23 TaxID=2933872 RepID=UPI001FF27839|nr:DUF1700 domain-containing protein [Ectobacillus sp. JY-23]UOY91642.1 DUF1700 domain-containing protein [Ectobacillus sp. JY-23]